jgi:hypothetical protein
VDLARRKPWRSGIKLQVERSVKKKIRGFKKLWTVWGLEEYTYQKTKKA